MESKVCRCGCGEPVPWRSRSFLNGQHRQEYYEANARRAPKSDKRVGFVRSKDIAKLRDILHKNPEGVTPIKLRHILDRIVTAALKYSRKRKRYE